MKQSRLNPRFAASFLRNRLSRNRLKPRLLKFRLLREVYKDYKALRGPKSGFWSRFPLQRLKSVGMTLPASTKDWNREYVGSDRSASSSPPAMYSADSLRSQESPPAVNPPSRRQRLFGLAKATRDMYMPKISSVALLASNGVSRSPQIEFDELGQPLTFPTGTVLTLFPSFTKPITAAESPSNEKGYLVSIRGWMWCPGLMSRKNRLVLSLAKQLTKGGGGEDLSQRAVERLNQDSVSMLDQDLSEEESLNSNVLATNSTEPGFVDSLIKERLSSFIATSIGKASLRIIVGSEDVSLGHDLVETQAFSDSRGHFEKEIFVPYKPSIIQVNAVVDESVYAFQEVKIVSPDGFGIISDIDDTVKHTGVIGDKRELMSRLLTGHISSWNIPAVVKWYQEILSMSSATFHYVSNSPWQLFNLIHQYFEAVKLPPGSIHLKQYSGNIIASLREPSSSRKRKTLVKILEDYPQKKFICIGDSGEHDFEAYVDLAKSNPNRIMAIYIRAVPGSFSLVNDHSILTKLQWMTTEWEQRKKAKKNASTASSTENLISLDLDIELTKSAITRSQKLPPIVPKKPSSLKGQSLRSPPPIPERIQHPVSAIGSSEGLNNLIVAPNTPDELSDHEDKPPTLPPRPRQLTYVGLQLEVNSFDNLNTLHSVNDSFELEDVDEKGAFWIRKLSIALHELDNSNTKIKFFEDKDQEFFKCSLAELKAELEV